MELESLPCSSLRVLAIPSHLAYVQNLGIQSGAEMGYSFRLPARLRDIPLDAIDIVHFHTTELFSLRELAAFLGEARRRSKGVVFTVHDLVPNIEDDFAEFFQKVRYVANTADAVITLTLKAADILRPLLDPGVGVTVLPHGAALPIAMLDATPSRSGEAWALFGALRTNRDIGVVVASWLGLAASQRRPMQVLLRTVGADDERRYVDLLALLRAVDSAETGFSLTITREFVSYVDLVEWMRPAGVIVLPYRRITHSGQLELARDLGIPVVAPDVCTLRAQLDTWPDQHPVTWFSPNALDEPSVLSYALTRELPRPSVDVLQRFHRHRQVEHEELLKGHRALYDAITHSRMRVQE